MSPERHTRAATAAQRAVWRPHPAHLPQGCATCTRYPSGAEALRPVLRPLLGDGRARSSPSIAAPISHPARSA